MEAEILQHRLTRGAQMLWDLEQKKQTTTREYQRLLAHFVNLLCAYEIACDGDDAVENEEIAA